MASVPLATAPLRLVGDHFQLMREFLPQALPRTPSAAPRLSSCMLPLKSQFMFAAQHGDTPVGLAPAQYIPHDFSGALPSSISSHWPKIYLPISSFLILLFNLFMLWVFYVAETI